MGIISLISSRNYIAVNKTLIKEFGFLEAVMLGELASESEYWEEQEQKTADGFFYSTVENVEENTTLSDSQQRKAIASLKEKGVLESVVRGLPAKRYFKLNEEMLSELLVKNSENNISKDSRTSSQKNEELDLEKIETNKNNSNINKNKNKKECITRFAVPSPEEVQEYCNERNNKVDAYRFIDYYTSKGWKVGNAPMKDWKAAVRTWERNDKNYIPPEKRKTDLDHIF